MMIPKVSIILPCYNVDKYLNRCMESLVSQTLRDIEIIMVDDKSPGDTPSMCDEWVARSARGESVDGLKLPPISVIHKPINEGLGMARNTGLEHATGEYVTFPDSDDYVDLDSFEVLYNLAKEHDCDAVYGEFNTSEYPGFHAVNYPAGLYDGHDAIQNVMLDMIGGEPEYNSDVKFQVSACKVIYRREILKRHNLHFESERKIISEDLVWNMYVLHHTNRIYKTDKRFYHYCLNMDSLSHVFRPDRYEKVKQLDEYMLQFAEWFDNKDEFYLRQARTTLFHLRGAVYGVVSNLNEKSADRTSIIRTLVSEPQQAKLLQTYPYHRMPLRYRVFYTVLRYRLFFLLTLISYVKRINDKRRVVVGGGKITTRQQLQEWIKADLDSYQMEHPTAARLTYGENWELFSYMRNLRYLEYYTNKPCKYPWDKVLRAYYWLKHRRNYMKMNIFIGVNSVGPGFHLQHRGYRYINVHTKIGTNCTILPMVLLGNKMPEFEGQPIVVGDNCYISTGVTILGPVTIGNNVTIGAGAVVTKDIPDGAIVAGVPAKVL